MSKKPFEAQQDLVNEEAKKRAEKIQLAGEKMLEIAVADAITCNDLQVILNQLMQNLNAVFMSRHVSEFVEPKKDKE